MSHLNFHALTHAQKVCRLYKKGLLTLRDWYVERWEFRYQAVLLRSRFDKHVNEKDLRFAKKLLQAGEKEWFDIRHPQPLKYAHSPGGICWGRYIHCDDWCLDYWHPLEKAVFPEYFARREQRKREYVDYYAQKYGKEVPAMNREYLQITEGKVEIADGFYQDKIEILPNIYKSAIKGTVREVEAEESAEAWKEYVVKKTL